MADGGKVDESAVSWTRPAGPPKVWFTVEGKGRSNAEGNVKFSIQEIPEDRYEDVVQMMINKFIVDEPICRSLNATQDPQFMEDSANVWRQILKQGLTVGALVDDPKGGKPIIAGVNVLGVEFKGQGAKLEELNVKSANLSKLLSIMFRIGKEARVYEKYGVDRYLFGFGLFVDPEFRGQSLSTHILNARRNIGREYGITATSTSFTSPISQKQAERCDYEVLVQRDYAEILDDEGNVAFPNITVKTFKVMGRRL